MSEPFLGEIRIFAFNFAPQGWAFCAGQLLPINQNTALFSLLGTTYGGDGIQTFALPDLQGRVPISLGQGAGLGSYVEGQTGGTETVTLTSSQMPTHAHGVVANGGRAAASHPDGATLAHTSGNTYAAAPDGTAMNAGMIGNAGGSQPFDNHPPFLTLNLCIAIAGIYPSRP